MKTGAAYIRVSTEEQTELSPTSQRKLIIGYAKKNDIILNEEFIFADEGISGTSTKHRTEFRRMIDIALQKPKPFDVILVWKFSRFARNREDSIVYKSKLRKAGIEVISISEPLGEGATSSFFEAIIEANDQMYSENLSIEVKRGINEKFSRGEALNYPAFGYDIVNKAYVINSVEAEAVKNIFTDFVSGVPIITLTRQINAAGFRTKRGNLFQNRSLKYILHNPLYIGKIRKHPKGKDNTDYWCTRDVETVQGIHQPIISEELFMAAQACLNANLKMFEKYSKPKVKNESMLRGLLKCSTCGSTLTPAKEGYQCHLYTKGHCPDSHYISRNRAEKIVLAAIDEAFEAKCFTVEQNEPAEERVNIDLDTEYEKLKRVKAAYEDGIDSLEEYKSNKKRIEENISRLKALNKKQKPKKVTAASFAKQNRDLLEDLKSPDISGADKNLILRSFVKRIVYTKKPENIDLYFYC